MNKRDFVLGGATTLTASVVLSTPAKAQRRSADGLGSRLSGRLERFPDLDARPDLDAWRRYVGQRFFQPAPGGAREVVLLRVEQDNAAERGEQFSLLFTSDTKTTLLSNTQRLRHGATGQQIAVFLQPAGSHVDGTALSRAEFNRLT